MKKLLLTIVLIGISVNGAAQTTTGTAQKVGNIWYYNFYTQPAPQIQVYRPLQVPLVNTFGPMNQALFNYSQAMQFRAQQQLQQQQLELQRQQNEILARQQINRLTDPAPDPAPITTTVQQDVEAAKARESLLDSCVGYMTRMDNVKADLKSGKASIDDVRRFCDEKLPK